MHKFITEFKKFITRGNVIDMAVGVIVGGAFTAIVNGMSNFILKPIINWVLALILGKNSLSELYTVLKGTYDETGSLVTAESIYIDWGSFINAVINFFLTAFVLFIIVKTINVVRERNKEFVEEVRKIRPTKADRKEMRKKGYNPRNVDSIAAFYAERDRIAKEEKAAAEEAARLERLANPTTEDLLKEIRDLLSTHT